MNKYNILTLNVFRSDENVDDLKAALINKYKNPAVYALVMKNINNWVIHFSERKDREFMNSDLIKTPDVTEQVYCMNSDFIIKYIQFIESVFPNLKPTDNFIYNDQLGIANKRRWINGGANAVNKGQSGITHITDEALKTVVDYKKPNGEQLLKHQYEQKCAEGRSFRQGHYARATMNGNNRVRIQTTDKYGDYSSEADRMLESWKHPTRLQHIRDDRSGEINRGKEINLNAATGNKYSDKLPNLHGNSNINYEEHFSKQNAKTFNGCNRANVNVGGDYTYQGSENDGETTYAAKFRGDNVNNPENSAQHVDNLLSSPMHIGLNDEKLWVDGDGFVDQTNAEAMQNLFRRNIFRSYPVGGRTYNKDNVNCALPHGDHAVNQMPFYERALYKRNYERDVEENIGGFEMGMIQRGHDMNSLLCRIDDSNKTHVNDHTFSGDTNNHYKSKQCNNKVLTYNNPKNKVRFSFLAD